MTATERTAYPCFWVHPSAAEFARLYTPTLRELDLSGRITRGGEGQRLAFLVMLKAFRRLGYFPKTEDLPKTVVSHVRCQLGLSEDVSATPRSRKRYRNAIREHIGVRVYGDAARMVAAEAVADAADLVNVAIEELVKERYELPAFSTLDRLARKVRYAVNSALFAGVDEGLSDADRSQLGRRAGLLVRLREVARARRCGPWGRQAS